MPSGCSRPLSRTTLLVNAAGSYSFQVTDHDTWSSPTGVRLPRYRGLFSERACECGDDSTAHFPKPGGSASRARMPRSILCSFTTYFVISARDKSPLSSPCGGAGVTSTSVNWMSFLEPPNRFIMDMLLGRACGSCGGGEAVG
eukprot:scaffold36698_cov46-Phaeocystis_antarctica.AAC.1